MVSACFCGPQQRGDLLRHLAAAVAVVVVVLLAAVDHVDARAVHDQEQHRRPPAQWPADRQAAVRSSAYSKASTRKSGAISRDCSCFLLVRFFALSRTNRILKNT
jgi:hypothetical protein